MRSIPSITGKFVRAVAFAIGLAGVLAWPLQATAADRAAPAATANRPLKIGVINIERVFREAPAAQRAQKRLEKEFSGREQDIQRLAKRVQALQDALSRANGLSSADRAAKERELASANKDLQHAQRDMMEKLNTRKNQEIVALNERIKKIVVDIAQREGFDLIMHEGIYYAVPRIDLTDRVIRALGDH